MPKQARDKEQLLDKYKSTLDEEIIPRLGKLFYNISIEPITVQAVERDGPYGSYGLGTFYVNLKEADKRSTFTIKPLTLHEAYPGHHYQDCYSQHFDIPLYRAKPLMGRLYSVPFHFPVYTAYAEGWALYAEYLGEEMGLYDGPYDLFGRYVSEIFRACRLVVDSGIHAFNWNRTQAIDFLRGYSDFPESQLEAEVDRYITAPGQACAYKVGEIKIRHMREKTQNSLGPLFDIREFHHQILQVGYVPLDILQEVVDDWVHTLLYPTTTKPAATKKVSGVTSQYGKLRRLIKRIHSVSENIFGTLSKKVSGDFHGDFWI
ncbi:hypothetical protein RRG08_050227 [Elysia crispata]|uniref:DUF885 domain-containing protein n=1 Tax=Elysia crispata TaxID=231223 RepID=A0AAE1D489_9GAST|nr:hypothetical protein RRG08_050227 [Elysia crispata]